MTENWISRIASRISCAAAFAFSAAFASDGVGGMKSLGANGRTFSVWLHLLLRAEAVARANPHCCSSSQTFVRAAIWAGV